jgi:hypothetical protein
MALAKRGYGTRPSTEVPSVSLSADDKAQKHVEIVRSHRRMYLIPCLIGLVMLTVLYSYDYSLDRKVSTGFSDNTQPTSHVSTVVVADELFPFLSAQGESKVPFPVIPALENCTVSFQPPQARKEESQWRKPFWIPAFPSSGGSNPTNKGDLSKELIGKLTGLTNTPVKNYHMSIRKRLKRCHGISETVGCTQGHPIVPIQPETKTESFQPKAIVFVRNFVSAFPASLTDKNIAYHNAAGQNTVAEYTKLRDEWVQPTFDSWKNLLEWWSTSSAYDVAMYVPFEDLVTTHREKGRMIVEKLSIVLQEGGFEVASSPEDLDCIWYTTIREEWIRQQSIMNYIPRYTAKQRGWIMSQLRQYIQEVTQRGAKSSDTALVAVLNRYLHALEADAPLILQHR